MSLHPLLASRGVHNFESCEQQNSIKSLRNDVDFLGPLIIGIGCTGRSGVRLAHLVLVVGDPRLPNAHQPERMLPLCGRGEGLRQDVGGLPISTHINEVKLFLLKLLLHPLETNVLGLVGIPHCRRVSSVHHRNLSLVIFHELHLIELWKMGFQTVDVCRRKAPLNIAIPDFINLFVNTCENRVLWFRVLGLGFTPAFCDNSSKTPNCSNKANIGIPSALKT